MKTKYKNSDIYVVSDGCSDSLSTKAHEHLRRGAISSADINKTDISMQVTCTRKSFLQNTHNKTELIRILRQRFTEIGNENEQSVCDADVLAIKKALEMAKHHQTTVVCDDTDILLLLVSLCHWYSTMKNIVFVTNKSVNNKKVHVEYSVRVVVNKQPLTPYLLFAQAWTGCGNTSAIQNQRKLKIPQQLK